MISTSDAPGKALVSTGIRGGIRGRMPSMVGYWFVVAGGRLPSGAALWQRLPNRHPGRMPFREKGMVNIWSCIVLRGNRIDSNMAKIHGLKALLKKI